MGIVLGVVEFNAQAYQPSESSQLSRLAGRRLGGATLLEWVTRRVSESQQLDKIVVIAGEGVCAEFARQWTPPNIMLFVSPENDSLGRLVSAAEKFNASTIVRTCVNRPFVDPVLIDRLACTARHDAGCDLIAYGRDAGGPIPSPQQGMLAECYAATALRRAHQLATRSDRDNIIAFMQSKPDRFRIQWIPTPTALVDTDVRLGVDLEEDWEHTQVIYEALGPEHLDWQGITDLLREQPAIRERMAVLNRVAN